MNLLKGLLNRERNHTNIKGLPPPHLHRCTDTHLPRYKKKIPPSQYTELSTTNNKTHHDLK